MIPYIKNIWAILKDSHKYQATGRGFEKLYQVKTYLVQLRVWVTECECDMSVSGGKVSMGGVWVNEYECEDVERVESGDSSIFNSQSIYLWLTLMPDNVWT